MSKLLIGFLLCNLLVACNETNTQKNQYNDSIAANKQAAEEVPWEAFPIPGYFENIPDTIDGCSGVFATSEAAFNQKQFIFISNLQGLGMIKLNGEIVYLQMKSRTEGPGDAYKEEYEGNGLTIIIDITKVGVTGDELNSNEGSFTLRRGNETKVMQLFGETGC